MGIARGVSLGPYEILSRIGGGGMGDVWRARDRRIGRDVAVKVLPEAFGESAARVQRFEQEARAAGGLNHPGLVTIFDVGTTDGAPYIVMELLEGETLREALGDTEPVRLPVRKAIDYGAQIAAALAVAHEKGITHRDLKPENIFISPEGRVKVLDFGLAKLAEDATDVDGRHRTARHLTSSGMVVGTPPYMSPEQVRAQPLDPRTDIFALGTVLYEMLSGTSPFERDSAVETMHAILSVEPPPLPELSPDIPPALDAIVSHCLEKNPRERFQSARDLAFQLRMLAGTQNNLSTGARDAAQRGRRWRGVALAAVVAAAIVALGGFALRRAGGVEPEAASRTFQQLTYADGVEAFPTLAPDGKTFAYGSAESGNRDIYVQRVDGRTPMNITSDSPDDDSEPAFSPDGSQIAFRSERNGGGIFVMGVTGESVRRLTDFGHNPSWAPDGKRIAVSTAAVDLRPHVHRNEGELWILDAQTGAKRRLHGKIGLEADALQPSWSPHGHRIAYWGVSSRFAQRDIYTIDPDAPDPKQTVVRVSSGNALHWNPVWSADGKFLYFGSNRDGTLNLWRVAMDEESGRPSGRPEPLSLPAAISGNFALSQNGEIAFSTAARRYLLLGIPFDAATAKTGQPRVLFGGSEEILSFEASPDGKEIAFTTGGVQEDLFVVNADGTRVRRFTNDTARDRGVTWSADGQRLYFSSNREGAYHIWSIRADGSDLTRVTDPGDLQRTGQRNLYRPRVSPDGRTLVVYTDSRPAYVHLDRPIAQRLEMIAEDFAGPEWSPDGAELAALHMGSSTIVVHRRGSPGLRSVAEGIAPHWLPGSSRLAFFAKRQTSVIDLRTGKVTTSSFTPPEGVELDSAFIWPRLSRDGSTLIVRQVLEQADIWMVRFRTSG